MGLLRGKKQCGEHDMVEIKKSGKCKEVVEIRKGEGEVGAIGDE